MRRSRLIADVVETIELFESETVVERGHRTVSWRIRLRDGWVGATEWPRARVTSLEPGPGTVWERRVELGAARGTELERVDSRPAPARRRTPLEYLERLSPAAARQVRRTRFRVGPGGRLVPERRARGPQKG